MLSLSLFLPLVLVAITVSWHNHDIRNIAFALLLSWAVSNATVIWLPFEYRIVIYPVLEVIVGLMAMGAWLVMRFTPGGSNATEGQFACIAIVMAAIANTAACINYAGTITDGHGDKYLFVLLTNVTFAVECILVGAWGVRDALYRTVGVARLLAAPRRPARQDALSKETGAEG